MAKTVNNYFVDTINKAEITKQLKSLNGTVGLLCISGIISLVIDILLDSQGRDLQDQCDKLTKELKSANERISILKEKNSCELDALEADIYILQQKVAELEKGEKKEE